jgi:hypothetical protein
MFKSTRFLLPLLAAAALGACEGTDSGSSRVSIRLVDAPGDFKEVKVQITELYLQGGSESDSTSGRLTLAADTSTYFDLLTLVGGASADLVRDAVIPAGTYSQLRVRVGDAYVVTRDGKVYATPGARLPAGMTATGTINLTSGKSRASGYKIRFPGPGLTVDGDSKIVALDFDVARSFGHVAGRSGQLVLNPQFTVTQVQLSGGISGLITPAAGVTFPACGGAATDVTHFTATATGPTTLSARAQADSRYKMAYVSPGTYAMGVAPVGYANGDSLMIAATPSVANLTLASGQNAVVDYSVTGITCKVKPA